MEKDATAEKRESIVICPSLVLTSSIRVLSSTRRFMSRMSAILGVPIFRRGKSSLDEVAFFVKKSGFKSFVVVFSRGNRPSLLRFYKLLEEGYFVEYGEVVIGDLVYGDRGGIFIGCRLTPIGVSEKSRKLWGFLYDLFYGDSCEGYFGKICEALIKDHADGTVLEFWYQKSLLMRIAIEKVILRRVG
ncbi:MAG: hypothetical protein Q6363_003925 [Candidatus Njordarchaeota archaeon]